MSEADDQHVDPHFRVKITMGRLAHLCRTEIDAPIRPLHVLVDIDHARGGPVRAAVEGILDMAQFPHGFIEPLEGVAKAMIRTKDGRLYQLARVFEV